MNWRTPPEDQAHTTRERRQITATARGIISSGGVDTTIGTSALTWSHRSISDWDHWINNIRDHRRIIWDNRSIIRGCRINTIWHPRSIAIWGRWDIITQAQHRNQPSAEEGPHDHNGGRTPAGKPRNRIYGMNTGRPRATGYCYSLRLHPQANFRLSLLPERRTHQHRDQEADTDSMINSGG